ncbi:HAD family hydrolase [Streptomyces albidoflavus]
MPAPPVTHLLFDFFGTLVDHAPGGPGQGFARTYGVTRGLGATLTYREFLAAWARTTAHFGRLSAVDDREYPMTDLGTAFLREVLGRAPARAETGLLVRSYLAEWNAGVRHLPGIGALLTGLAAQYRLAVVSNTQDAELLPGHLEAMGVRQLFDTVVTSFEVGWRKPHPAVYRAALRELRVDPGSAVFVGDTYRADHEGPTRVGIRAFLIDPQRRAPVPEEARLASVFALPARLAALGLAPPAPF